MSWSQNELRGIRVIHVITQYSPRPEEGQGNGANCAEFAWLYLTQNELRETHVIRCPLVHHLVQRKCFFWCGLHEICITRGYCWRMAQNLLSPQAILSCLPDPRRLLFVCGLHEICVTHGYCWRMVQNLLSL